MHRTPILDSKEKRRRRRKFREFLIRSDKYIIPEDYDFYDLESINREKEIREILKIDVPNDYRDEARIFLRKFCSCYRDQAIYYSQFTELTKDYVDRLNWFPNSTPKVGNKKFCRDTYDYVIWKFFVIKKKISHHQFADLDRRNIRIFRKKMKKNPRR